MHCVLILLISYRYLSIVREEGLEISQPALDPDKSDVYHPITARVKKLKVHRLVQFVSWKLDFLWQKYCLIYEETSAGEVLFSPWCIFQEKEKKNNMAVYCLISPCTNFQACMF